VATTSIDVHGRRGETRSGVVPGLLAFDGVDVVALSVSGSQLLFTVLDRSQATIATGSDLSPRAFDCNAHDCAAAWFDGSKNWFQRIAFDGTPIGDPLELATGFMGLSGRDDEYLLVFRWDSNLYATRWADGKLSGVTDLHADARGIAIASKPDGWLVVASPAVIRLDANAQVLGRNTLFTVDEHPSATWDGRDWIVAWDADGDIRAARIHDDGTMDAAFDVAATSDQEHAPVVRSAGNGRTAVAYTRSTDDRIYGVTTRVFVRWIE
jgi:hypothetical protein